MTKSAPRRRAAVFICRRRTLRPRRAHISVPGILYKQAHFYSEKHF
jgi:hypothetical protein